MSVVSIFDLLGLAAELQHANRPAEAAQAIRLALKQRPAHVPTLGLAGVLALRDDRPEQGVQWLAKALSVDPAEPSALVWRGRALLAAGRPADAAVAFQRALIVAPTGLPGRLGLGSARLAGREWAAAAEPLQQVLTLAPWDAESWSGLSLVYSSLRQSAPAIDAALRARVLDPGCVPAEIHLGRALLIVNDAARAELAAVRALRLAPDAARAHWLAGSAALMGGALARAGRMVRRATVLEPALADAWATDVMVRHLEGRLDEALRMAARALAAEPGHAAARFHRGLMRLASGDLEAGWQDYEARWSAEIKGPHAASAVPLWQGEPIAGRTLLLQSEQGFGDAIQLARYVPHLARGGVRVIMQAWRPLHRLLRGLPGLAELIEPDDAGPRCDVRLPLMSLPRLLGTTLANIPADLPYLSADPGLIARWAGLAGATRPRIGLAWRGNANHSNDRYRSLPIACVARLVAAAGGTLYSLQPDAEPAELELLDRAGRVIPLGAELTDFADTAAALTQLDLVITVDTALAHLAGALARPVWILLPVGPDWRWLADRADSPWYPSARLFRQSAPGDWDGVIDAVGAALRAFVPGACSQPAGTDVED